MKGRLLFYKSINFMNKIYLYNILSFRFQTLTKYKAHLAYYVNEKNPVDNLTLIIGNVCNIVNNQEYAWDKSVKYVMWAIKYVKSRAKVYSLVSKIWQA